VQIFRIHYASRPQVSGVDDLSMTVLSRRFFRSGHTSYCAALFAIYEFHAARFAHSSVTCTTRIKAQPPTLPVVICAPVVCLGKFIELIDIPRSRRLDTETTYRFERRVFSSYPLHSFSIYVWHYHQTRAWVKVLWHLQRSSLLNTSGWAKTSYGFKKSDCQKHPVLVWNDRFYYKRGFKNDLNKP
jgi:hypothetical protein